MLFFSFEYIYRSRYIFSELNEKSLADPLPTAQLCSLYWPGDFQFTNTYITSNRCPFGLLYGECTTNRRCKCVLLSVNLCIRYKVFVAIYSHRCFKEAAPVNSWMLLYVSKASAKFSFCRLVLRTCTFQQRFGKLMDGKRYAAKNSN